MNGKTTGKKGARTRQKILENAIQLFTQHGFDDVSVDAIVEAAGVSKGTFYIYFESKDMLITTLLSDYVKSLDADYQAHLDSLPAGITASDMLLSLIAKISDVITGPVGCDRMKIIYKVQLTGTVDVAAVLGYDRQLYKMFADVLAQGIKQGEFRAEFALNDLTKHFVMAIRGLCYEWCIRYPDFDLKAQGLSHFQILLDGIRA